MEPQEPRAGNFILPEPLDSPAGHDFDWVWALCAPRTSWAIKEQKDSSDSQLLHGAEHSWGKNPSQKLQQDKEQRGF